MSKVSVIVPVFNKAHYLRACLDSLLNQSLCDIEILCIDDKSTDGSLDILKEYAAKDKRIHLLLQKNNQGVSVARNIGIQKAKGEFIAFVDADDFVGLDFYEKLYNASEGYDCVKGEIWDYDDEIGRCTINDTCNLNDKIRSSGNPAYFHHGFTSAIYRREFIARYGFCFPENLSYNEDPFFSITISTKLTTIKIVSNAYYYYRTVNSSLSRNISSKQANDLCRSVSGIISYLEHCNYPVESRYIIANQFIALMSGLIVEGKLCGGQINQIEKELSTFLGIRPRIGCGIKVSVIVPVYNGEKYLRRTLGCLLLQSLYDIEIICVNDCSKDGSMDILKEYQSKDNRVRIIDCAENGGESKARNIGIHAARGEYIAFMDQDDRLDLNFYETLYAKAVETNADIVKGEVEEQSYDGQSTIRNTVKVEQQPLYFTGDWWTAIYKRDFILRNNIELPEGFPLGGDLKFLIDASCACNKLSVVHGVYYYHIMHPDSGDSEITPLNKIESVLSIFSYILNKIEEHHLAERDMECYVYYHYSYLQHAFVRIQKCPELVGKKLCCDFIFQRYEMSRCKLDVLRKLRLINPLLAEALENNRKYFIEQLIEYDVLSGVFYERNKEDKVSVPVPCTIVVPYINPELLDKYIVHNAFFEEEEALVYCFVDNRLHNKPISVIYNDILDNYDYAKESWLILMHSDFEFLSFPSNILCQLDTSKIYGPVGTKAYQNNGKMCVVAKGDVIEKTPDNSLYNNAMVGWYDLSVDTLDCQCIIVHSSLVEKYHLRFDPNTLYDLYVEDFCINATKKYGIQIESVFFDCAHHSGYIKEPTISPRYITQLKYINKKYPDELYGGTVTPIGGKILPSMTQREFNMFLVRQEIISGKEIFKKQK